MAPLLIIGYVWPEPNSSAAGQRMLQLIESFQLEGYQVHFASPAQQGEHQFDLSSINVTSHQIKLNCQSFDSFIEQLEPAIVLFDRFMMEEQFGWRVAKFCPQTLRILDSEDLHFLRDARQKIAKQQTSLIIEEVQKEQLHGDLAKREIAAIFRCDLTFTISTFEMQLLTHQFQIPKQQLLYLPLMIEPINLERQLLLTNFTQRQNFICIGNFRHQPNWDAVLQLKKLWPKIKQALKKHPSFADLEHNPELHIYGAYPPPKATQLENKQQGFMIKGWAEDAQLVMANARVCLAPIRFGAGIKGKLLEAMQTGTPSITSEIGCEGMLTAEQDWNGAIYQSEEEFIQQAVNFYYQQPLHQQAQKIGWQLIVDNYQKEKHQSNLISTIKRLVNNIEQHRQGNFIGQMLQHHSMKSTQYMAQWIEAKNSQPQ